MLAEYFDDYASRYKHYKDGRFCYEDGLIYRGLEFLHQSTGDDLWLSHLRRLADPQIGRDGSLKGYDLSDYNIDNILAGRSLLYLEEQTGDAKYMVAADTLARQLETQPRTRSGVFWHKLRYPWQIWLDGIYMGHPFRIAHALKSGQTSLIEDSLCQIKAALEATLDPSSGLYKHAFDEAKEQPWADQNTGHSPAFWARAIGWLAMALVDVVSLTENADTSLRNSTVELLNKILALKKQDGLWLQVIDRPELQGNYQETSASAMFTYALLQGERMGLVSVPDGLFNQLVQQSIRPREGGGYEMVEMCEVAGLGWYENRYRDGSAEYYLTEARVADDAKGVGPLMMAAALSGI